VGSIRRWLALGISGILLAAPACDRRKRADPTALGAARTAGPALLPRAADPVLYGELTRLVERCRFDLAVNRLACPGDEARALSAHYTARRRSRVDAVPTFTAALSADDPRLQAAAAHVLHLGFRESWGPELKPGALGSEEAKRFLDVVLRLPLPRARHALPAAVHAAVLGGQAEGLFRALERAASEELRVIGYRYVLTHGRLGVLPKLRDVARQASTPVVLAALQGTEHLQRWTAEEQSAICAWAAEFLSDRRPSIVSRTASVLRRCGGSHLDPLIDAVERSLRSGKLTLALLSGVRDLCTDRVRSGPRPPSAAQCERVRALLERVVLAETLGSYVRATALLALAETWPDGRTAELARPFEQLEDERLREASRSVARRVAQAESVRLAGPGARDPRAAAPQPPM